jgi:DNA polymerase
MNKANILKQQQYNELVRDVANCVACDKYKLKKKNGEIIELTHDKDRIHINLWAHWQGSLDAEILLIGQDWGRISSELDAKLWANKKTYMTTDKADKNYSITDANLRTLFMETFDIDILYSNEKLFFTNSIQCYKTGNLSNKTSEKWYEMCNVNFVERLINIIKPKLIITLGKNALNGLNAFGNFKSVDGEVLNDSYFSQKFNNIVDNGLIKLRISSGYIVNVFPVFHCGILSCNLNRSFEKQLKDWERIKGTL